MIYKKTISINLDNRMLGIEPPKKLPQVKLVRLGNSIDHIALYYAQTLHLDPDFQPLVSPNRRIYVVGSGASFLQAQFLATLLQRYLGLNVISSNPFSLKIDSIPKKGETVIVFSQKLSPSAKRQIDYYRSIGVNVVVFTARYRDNLPGNVQKYKFLPSHSFTSGEITPVPVIGPISSYLQIIRYVHFLIKLYGNQDDAFDLKYREAYERIKASEERFNKMVSTLHLDEDQSLTERPIVIIGSGIGMVSAQHIALALTEGALMDVHAYEMENYTHGLRFFDHGQPRTFIILKNLANKPFYQSAYEGIFTESHKVIEFFSLLDEPFRIFEYMILAFRLLLYLTNRKGININRYPGKGDPGAKDIHTIIF